MQIDLTHNDVNFLQYCIDRALQGAGNPVFIADAKAMKLRLDNFSKGLPDVPASFDKVRGRVANAVLAAVREMPETFCVGEVVAYLIKCGHPIKRGSVYGVLYHHAVDILEIVERGRHRPGGTLYRKKPTTAIQG